MWLENLVVVEFHFLQTTKQVPCHLDSVAQALTLACAEVSFLRKQAPAGVPVPHEFCHFNFNLPHRDNPCLFQLIQRAKEDRPMRFMLKAILDTDRANAAAKAGTLGKTIQDIVAELRPEAAYFTDDHGKRTAYIIFDMRDASQIPAVAEPWFLAFKAEVEFHAVMVPKDLSKAGSSIERAARRYAPAA